MNEHPSIAQSIVVVTVEPQGDASPSTSKCHDEQENIGVRHDMHFLHAATGIEDQLEKVKIPEPSALALSAP